MKGKRILSISIGCVALILTMVMFTQFKTVEHTDIVAIETMRETELRAEYTSWQEKYQEVETKLQDTRRKIEEYKNQMSSQENATELLKQEVHEAQKNLGYTNVHGEGIVITLEDNSKAEIERFDLISLLNELKHAGAEAISINGERIVGNSDIALINNELLNSTMLMIHAKRITTPYTVKAIGDRKYLESAITIKNGFLDEMKAYEKDIHYSVEKEIVIEKYDGEMPLDYANKKEVKGD